MDFDDDFDDILPEARIFDNRVDDIWNEKKEAIEELYNKFENEKEEVETAEMVEKVIAKKNENKKSAKTTNKKGRGRKILTKDEIEIPRRSSPRKKAQSVPIATVEENEEMLSSGILLTATAKKRLKKLQEKTERENQRIEKETKQLLSSFRSNQTEITEDILMVDDDIPEQEIVLKIRYNSKIYRVTVGEKEVFLSIFKKVADLIKLKPTEILLCHGDKTITLQDTPFSLKLKLFHIIDCIPYQAKDPNTESNTNKLIIKLQSNDTRKKTEMEIHKLEKFEEIIKRYAELKKIPVNELVFEFDGEKIEKSDTPSDLEIETGCCIDVRVLSFKEPKSKTQQGTEMFETIAPGDMLDICELD